MADKKDLSRASDAELIAEYVENVQRWETLDHVAAQNRLMDRRSLIVDEIRRRSGGTMQPLRQLLEHADLDVRLSAAIKFRTVDHVAFETVVRELARRSDAIGRDAQGTLRDDAHFQKVGYPEAEPPSPPAAALSPQARWQSENPPPTPPTGADIEARLREALPRDADKLLRLARPAVGLWPQRPSPELPTSASRLGGMPHVPKRWRWPMADTEPMLFLGQINCADLKGAPAADAFPSSGLLAFFGDFDSVMGSLGTGRGIVVQHWADIDRLVPGTPPDEPAMVFPLCALALRPLIDLPDPGSTALQAVLADEKAIWRYVAVYNAVRFHGIPDELQSHCGLGKLGGWPTLVQDYDVDLLTEERTDWRLLLQLDPYSNGEALEEWGPGGSLYFLISDRDLRKRRFDRCEFDMQYT